MYKAPVLLPPDEPLHYVDKMACRYSIAQMFLDHQLAAILNSGFSRNKKRRMIERLTTPRW